MRKIYIALAVLFVLLVGLMIVYRIENPPQAVPVSEYTETKAELLLHNYLQQAEENGEEPLGPVADRNTVYAVMVEMPMYGVDGSDVAAGFAFFDHYGACTRLLSDGSGFLQSGSDGELAETAKKAVADVMLIFDETFSKAKKADYAVPAGGEVKIYVRAGDGVYVKKYAAEDAPAELLSAFAATMKAGADGAAN